MIRLAVCDDDKATAAQIESLIKETSRKNKYCINVDVYHNAEEIACRILKEKNRLDIIILDIDMPHMSGLELAKELRAAEEKNLAIIFLSAHDEFVFDSFEVSPLRFVRKTLMETQLPPALQAAVKLAIANADDEITLKTENGERRVMLSQIVYYEVFGRKIAVYLNDNEELVVRKTLKEMQDTISDKRFVSLHRDCVVNASFVKNVDDCSVTLDNGHKLVVSRRRIKEVKETLLEFWGDLI